MSKHELRSGKDRVPKTSTIEADLFHEMVFDSLEHMQNELFEYMVYYNYARPHKAAKEKPPSHMIEKNI